MVQFIHLDRAQRVRIGTDASEERSVKYGVLQGSVLGPLLFTVYTAPLQGILTRHSVDYHKFAEDLQIYTSYCPHIPGDLECVVQRLGDCIGEVKCWMIKQSLKLNESETEFMVARSPHNLKTSGLPENPVVGGVNIEPVVSVRNLGT